MKYKNKEGNGMNPIICFLVQRVFIEDVKSKWKKKKMLGMTTFKRS